MFSMIMQQMAAKRKRRKREGQRLAGKWRAALPPISEEWASAPRDSVI